MANLFSKKIKGEEHRSQLQPVIFSDEDKPVAALKKSQIDNYDELESYKRLRKKRIQKSFIRMSVWFLIVLLMPMFVFFTIMMINPKAGHNIFGYTFYIVSSESMKPSIQVGDCVVIKSLKSREDVQIGDDITYIRASDGEIVTHRIISTITNKNGEIEYITRGTNNLTADRVAVSFENIIGKRVMTAKTLGQLVTFFRTPYGIVVFLAIFVCVISAFYFSFKMSEDIRAVGVK